MKIIRKIFLLIIFLAILATIGWWLIHRYPTNPISLIILEKTETINQNEISSLSENVLGEFQTLTDRAQELGEHTQNILGKTTQKSESGLLEGIIEPAPKNEENNQQPLHERALEYGRYLYCQEVIKEYEQKY